VKKKILFVDDESDILNVSTFMLKKMGFEVFGALNGQKALDLAREKIPDLIFLDVYLPGMKGDEVAGILKKDKKTKRIPIVLISADLTTLEARFRKCGADDYLGKPFEVDDMLDTIKKYIPEKD
jgi:two-component system alkaline phosphatase synthesis response regulator PhoP